MVKESDRLAGGTSEERLHELERTIESLREDAEVMHVLLGLASALAEVRTVDATLEKAVRMIPEVFSADRCFAARWDEAMGQFDLLAHFGYDQDESDALVIMCKEGKLPLLATALRERAPVFSADAAHDARINPDEVEQRQLGALIGIPLLRWGEEFGGIAVEFRAPHAFSNKDVSLARGIARQVAVALANARRFNLLQNLRSFGLKIADSKLNLASATREVAAGAAELLNADAALVCFLDSQSRTLVLAGHHEAPQAVAEQAARIDLTSPPWNGLLEGRTLSLTDLDATLGVEDGPVSAVATSILGTETPVLGAIVLLFNRSFELGPEEADALDVLAAQAATAMENAQRFERQRRVARSLQEALLSTEQPNLEVCEFAAVYEPATTEADVGGDFYDVFELPSGDIAAVVGDVSGKGAEAAALTAMAKYMLRAFAMRDPNPSSVFFHLNNALLQGFTEDRFTTCAYALFDPQARACKVALAGHPPPLIYRRATGKVESLSPQGSILGVFEDSQFAFSEFELQEGDIYVVFTDGLIEARNNGDLYGRERVIESLAKHAPVLPADQLARAIYNDANAFGSIGDDTVVFTFICKFLEAE